MIKEKKIKRNKTHQSSTVVRTIPIMRRYLLQERVKCIDEENDCSTDNIAQHLKNVCISEEVIEVKVTEKISATEDSKGV